jgi:hypothetical protein
LPTLCYHYNSVICGRQITKKSNRKEVTAMAHEDHTKTYKIFVDGSEKTVDHEIVSFEEIVALSVGQPVDGTIYSVTFDKAKEPKSGELLTGQTVEIHNNTEFDVDDTGRS